MTPTSETELAEMIQGASGPLCIRGGATRGIDRPGDVLTTTGLSGITLYEPGALTMVAKAGTPVAEVVAALDNEGQMLAFEPYDLAAITAAAGKSTIGGVFATNASGPRRVAVGAARDFLLGVRLVDGGGTLVSNGGRVMKNVTGYDLVKLMAGSFGTLGVFSEVSFKVLPKPETTQTLVWHGLTDEQAGALMRAAMGAPFDVTGAAHVAGSGELARTYIRVEGFEGSVRYRAEQLKALLAARFGAAEIAETTTHWTRLRDAAPIEGAGDIWRISVKPTDGPAAAKRLRAEAHMFDWSGGLIWARVPAETDVRAQLGGLAGHATLIRGEGQARFHPEAPGAAKIAAGLRARFDPRGILNPGLMG